jgi:hypothetical protein
LLAGGDPTSAALRALEYDWPDFVKGGKLQMPSQEAATRLFRFLSRVEGETLGLEDLLDDPYAMLPKHLFGVFTRVSDFCVRMSHEEVLSARIFITPESFNDWVAHVRGGTTRALSREVVPTGSEGVTPLKIALAGSAIGGEGGPGAFVAELAGGALAVIETHPGAYLRDAALSAMRWPQPAPGALPAMWVATKSREIAPLDEALSGAGVLRLDAAQPQARGAYAGVLPLGRGTVAT